MLWFINVLSIIWLCNFLFSMETLYFFAPNMKGVVIFSASVINLASFAPFYLYRTQLC